MQSYAFFRRAVGGAFQRSDNCRGFAQGQIGPYTFLQVAAIAYGGVSALRQAVRCTLGKCRLANSFLLSLLGLERRVKRG